MNTTPMENQHNFDSLSMRNKALLVEDIGIPLCSIEFYDHRIHLYDLNNMFVESWQNIETKEIETIKVASYGDLDKFLSRVTVDGYKKGRNKRGSHSL